ncbi:hypothetical protein A9Q81_02815 [Gammaproteobacteria bacterium 42_54_T18]|nr:hypothetical protein A9Q81_02815 [Gammaproteobacteria bacterium 42_54_T18]
MSVTKMPDTISAQVYARHGIDMSITQANVFDLVSDPTLQHRVKASGKPFSNEYLMGLSEDILEHGQKKPIKVVCMAEDSINTLTGDVHQKGKYLIVDGFHRCQAIIALATNKGKSYAPAKIEVVKTGTFQSAIQYSLLANADNEYSQARGKGDIRNAISTYIKFLKADSKQSGKILFPFKYADWAAMFKCGIDTLKRNSEVAAYRDELTCGEREWINAESNKNTAIREIAKRSCEISYSGHGISKSSIARVNSVPESVSYTNRDKEKSEPLSPCDIICINLDEQFLEDAVKTMRRDDRLDIFEQWVVLGKTLSRNNGMNGLSPYSTITFVPTYKKGHFVFIPDED